MFTRLIIPVALLAALIALPVHAQTPGAATPQSETIKKTAENERDAAAAKKKAEEDARATGALMQGKFRTDKLAGGTDSEFQVPQPANRLSNVNVALKWVHSPDQGDQWSCRGPEKPTPDGPPSTKAADKLDATKTIFAISIPPPPCYWPLTQYADITITATVDKEPQPKQLLETSRMPVSVLWFPQVVTLLVLALIYPGAAAAGWYVSVRNYKRDHPHATPDEIRAKHDWLIALDPIELTKNAYGRASIAKLQIFLFTFIVFGLLLFNVLRNGLIANMSQDILYLMGISAVGAAGGKMAYTARRRLSLDNWAWLRRKGWLPDDKDVVPRAKWSELFVDSNTKEFDPYRFQMAVFSLVVAVALIETNATALEAFKIPPEMLGLLGISQVVFIGGQAINKSGYDELDSKLSEVRSLAKNVHDLTAERDNAAATAAAATDAEKAKAATLKETEAANKATAEMNKYTEAVAQAAQMFASVYLDQDATRLDEMKTSAALPT